MECICWHCFHCRYIAATWESPEEYYCDLDKDEWCEDPVNEEDCDGFYDSKIAEEEYYWEKYGYEESGRCEDD